VSERGANIVGFARDVNAPGNVYAAWVWDSSNGMRLLQDVLASEFGLALDGWHLEFAKDITPDARVIVGTGINPDGNREGWLVRLDHPIGVPEPNSIVIGLVASFIVMWSVRARREFMGRNGNKRRTSRFA
jgi:hypothetical protein